MPPEELFLSQLPLIERIAAFVCRRYCCTGQEVEDFASQVKLKLIEDDYAVLRKLRDPGGIKSYLNVVVHNLFRDFRIQKWGKWRPSAAAKQLGEVAVLLDTLLHRDGRTRDEAIDILRLNHRVAMSRMELVELAEKLPPRKPRHFAEDEEIQEDRLRDGVPEGDREATAERAERALAEAMAALGDEDRLILKMSYEGGFTAGQIGRVLGLPQRAVYSRRDKVLAGLEEELGRRGLDRAAVATIVDWEGAGGIRVDFGPGGDELGRAP